ncbi:hypothetical protein MRB53_039530 [Persea americana]|nr:hypothetical protein MRB53_039530 [Persea americana]
MFSSALKSLSSNITSNYSIAPNPSTVAGPWKIFDGKKRNGGKLVSIFVFDRKALEALGTGNLNNRNTATTSLKQAHEDVFDRLRKEASSLARLRHPSILELAEPVEETRNGGLMFATEPVTASLAGLLAAKDSQEKAGGVGERGSKFVIEDADGKGRRRRELEIEEVDIQKGLLQIGKGLEFLHESAGLVHANLTPEAIFVNAKGDWKISGLGWSSAPDQSSAVATQAPTLILSDALAYDARLPQSVQLNLDYASPDFILDQNINSSADMFSLGLVIIALYNSPHKSPIDTGQEVATYKRIFSSPSTIPQQTNNFLCSQTLPRDILTNLLPRLITRRPAQRFNARDIQQAEYFDNILVSTIRFLDSMPAKNINEKSQFLRGLPRVLPQFPKSVLEKKVLPVLLDETKDTELIPLVLQNAFKIIEMVPNGKRVFSDVVAPRLRRMFLSTGGGKNAVPDRDVAKETGLKVLMENITIVTANCSGSQFKDDILPIIYFALDSPTHAVVDAALSTLPSVLPNLDFSSIKNELFPVVAQVFSKTSSMAIKIKGLMALNTLCGGTMDGETNLSNELTSAQRNGTSSSSAVLDKYTVQEKVVPLLRGIKTKEPAVMMAALAVFTRVAIVADSEFLAIEVLPTLWQFSLGPLLSLDQFQSFMDLIKKLSTRIETEQTRKLQGFSGGAGYRSGMQNGAGADGEPDFESLVSERRTGSAAPSDTFSGGWDVEPSLPTRPKPDAQRLRQQPRTQESSTQFSWSTPASPPISNTRTTQTQAQAPSAAAPARTATSRAAPVLQSASHTITPDTSLNSYASLMPAPSSILSSSMQPMTATKHNPMSVSTTTTISSPPSSSINWGGMSESAANPWAASSASTMATTNHTTANASTGRWPVLATSNSTAARPSGGNTLAAMSNGTSGASMNTLGMGVGSGASASMGMGMNGMNIAALEAHDPWASASSGSASGNPLDKYGSLL